MSGPHIPGQMGPTVFGHPLLFPLGGPGQVWLDVGLPHFLLFSIRGVWSSSESFASGQQRGAASPAINKVKTLREHSGDHTPQNSGYLTESCSPLLSALGAQGCACHLQAEVSPCFLLQGLHELGSKDLNLRHVAAGHRAEEAQAVSEVNVRYIP